MKSRKQLIFFEYMNILLNTNIELLSALDIFLIRYKYNEVMLFKRDLLNGKSVDEALIHISSDKKILQYAKYAIKTGSLKDVFKIIYTVESIKQKLQNKFINAMIYPLLILFVSFSVISMLFIFVIPKFTSIYDSLEVELPLLTKVMIYISEHILIILLSFFLIISLIVLFIRFLKEKYEMFYYKFIMYIPLYKEKKELEIIQEITYLLSMKLSIVESLELISTNNKYINKIIRIIISKINKGNSINNSFQNTFFSNDIKNYIYLAEKSNMFYSTFNNLSNYLENNYIKKIEMVIKLTEPILILIISLIVFVIILSISIPLFNLPSYF